MTRLWTAWQVKYCFCCCFLIWWTSNTFFIGISAIFFRNQNNVYRIYPCLRPLIESVRLALLWNHWPVLFCFIVIIVLVCLFFYHALVSISSVSFFSVKVSPFVPVTECIFYNRKPTYISEFIYHVSRKSVDHGCCFIRHKWSIGILRIKSDKALNLIPSAYQRRLRDGGRGISNHYGYMHITVLSSRKLLERFLENI